VVGTLVLLLALIFYKKRQQRKPLHLGLVVPVVPLSTNIYIGESDTGMRAFINETYVIANVPTEYTYSVPTATDAYATPIATDAYAIPDFAVSVATSPVAYAIGPGATPVDLGYNFSPASTESPYDFPPENDESPYAFVVPVPSMDDAVDTADGTRFSSPSNFAMPGYAFSQDNAESPYDFPQGSTETPYTCIDGTAPAPAAAAAAVPQDSTERVEPLYAVPVKKHQLNIATPAHVAAPSLIPEYSAAQLDEQTRYLDPQPSNSTPAVTLGHAALGRKASGAYGWTAPSSDLGTSTEDDGLFGFSDLPDEDEEL
jgi:hypothetical protein